LPSASNFLQPNISISYLPCHSSAYSLPITPGLAETIPRIYLSFLLANLILFLSKVTNNPLVSSMFGISFHSKYSA
jgi:hypothetical protein